MTCKEARQMVMPYIRDELTDKELEAFLGHVGSCGECYEELDIYYTIYAGLAQLDDGDDPADMHDMLEDSVHASQKRIRGRHIFKFAFVFSQVAAAAALVVNVVLEIMNLL